MISSQAVLLLALASTMALWHGVSPSPVLKSTDSEDAESPTLLVPVHRTGYQPRLTASSSSASDYYYPPEGAEELPALAYSKLLLDELLLARLRDASTSQRFLAASSGGRTNAKRAGRPFKIRAAMGVDLPDYILHMNKGRNFDFSSFREKMQKSG